MSKTFNHPTLGELRPIWGETVNQFLGLKYAWLTDRFSTSELFSPAPSKVTDATQYGPSVVTHSSGCKVEYDFIQQSLPERAFASSELDGLNLNIVVPTIASSGKGLPCFVFIHGGGFTNGGNSWPQYDLTRFVQLSIEQGERIIAININYRMGVFGFLTSEELRKAGYLGNNGLRDQRVAFEWIKRNIAGFGGDPDNVTVGGQSAGGISTTLHLYSKTPQFARAISMGGTTLLMKPLPRFVHEMTYKTVVEALGLSAKTPEERISILKEIPAEELLSRLPPGLPLQPVMDGDFIPTAATFKDVADLHSATMPGKYWCKGLLIGNNQLDASIVVGALEARKGRLITAFISSMRTTLAPYDTVADTIFTMYGMAESMSDSEAVTTILHFVTDIGLTAPVLTFAEGFSSKAYVYFFNEPNPWEGRFKGQASHILDVAFLFQNFNAFLDAAQAQSARNFAVDVIRFVGGKAPWTVFDSEAFVARVYGPSQGRDEALTLETARREEASTGRRLGIFRFAEQPGLDVISNALGVFLAGK